MRICFLQEHLLCWNGGIRYLFEVTRRLVNECDIIRICHWGISSENHNRFTEAKVYPLQMSTVWAGTIRYWVLYPYYLINNSRRLKYLPNIADVVFSSSPTTHILCLLAGIKPILVIFELNPWLYSKEYRSGLSPLKLLIVKFWGPVAKYMEKKAYQNAVKIIAYSKFVQSEIKRVYGVDSEVVYTGIDTEFFKETVRNKMSQRLKLWEKVVLGVLVAALVGGYISLALFIYFAVTTWH